MTTVVKIPKSTAYFKQKLEDGFLEYKNLEYSSSTLKEANLVYRQQRHREIETINETRRRDARDGPFHPLKFPDKDETNLRNIPEKNTLMGTLMITNKEILLCYEAPIKKHLFRKEVVKFSNHEFKQINQFTTLKFLQKAEEIGLHYNHLCKRLEMYLLSQTKDNTTKN